MCGECPWGVIAVLPAIGIVLTALVVAGVASLAALVAVLLVGPRTRSAFIDTAGFAAVAQVFVLLLAPHLLNAATAVGAALIAAFGSVLGSRWLESREGSTTSVEPAIDSGSGD
jgi:hypothetical protein